MIRKLFTLMLLLVLAGYVTAEVAAKRYAESKIAAYVSSRAPQASNVQAKVSVPLIFGLVTKGRVNRIEVSAGPVGLPAVSAERVSLVFSGTSLDALASVRQSRPVVRSIDRLDLVADITEAQASKILPPGLAFKFRDGQVSLAGPTISLTGRFEVGAASDLVFEPQTGALENLGLTSVVLRLARAPLIACVKQVSFSEGVMHLSCSLDHPPARIPP